MLLADPITDRLVFAGLGEYAGGNYFHDSSRSKVQGITFQPAYATGPTWRWDTYLQRWTLSFDAVNDCVNLGDTANFETIAGASGVGSFSAWVKPVSTAAQGEILGKYGTSNNIREYALDVVAGGALRLLVTDLTGDNLDSLQTAGTLTAGMWTHVCATFDNSLSGIGNKVKLYLNGVRDAGTRVTFIGSFTAITDSAEPLLIGALNAPSPIICFNGQIADVLIFGRVLSPAEVARLANPAFSLVAGGDDDFAGVGADAGGLLLARRRACA